MLWRSSIKKEWPISSKNRLLTKKLKKYLSMTISFYNKNKREKRSYRKIITLSKKTQTWFKAWVHKWMTCWYRIKTWWDQGLQVINRHHFIWDKEKLPKDFTNLATILTVIENNQRERYFQREAKQTKVSTVAQKWAASLKH